jgi:hypothetical protein
MPDYLIILLTIIALISLNLIVWVVRDMDRDDRELQDIEHWLEHGENNDNKHS